MWLSGEGMKGGAGRQGFDPPFYTWWCFPKKNVCENEKREYRE